LLDGTGFALDMVLAWLMAYVAQGFLKSLPMADLGTAVDNAAIFAGWVVVDTLPMVPLFEIMANRTPAAGIQRFLWLIAMMMGMWVYWASLDWLSGDTSGLVPFRMTSLPCAYEAALVFAATIFKSSARTATSTLVQRQIDGAALEADAKRARLQLLPAQIEPYFLFNKLATVRTLVRLDRAGTIDMLDRLRRCPRCVRTRHHYPQSCSSSPHTFGSIRSEWGRA
jgi:hypothetical protein